MLHGKKAGAGRTDAYRAGRKRGKRNLAGCEGSGWHPGPFGWLLDLPRIAGFLKMLTFRNLSGKIICFDFQRDVLENYCVSIGAALEFETIDFKKFERRFFGD